MPPLGANQAICFRIIRLIRGFLPFCVIIPQLYPFWEIFTQRFYSRDLCDSRESSVRAAIPSLLPFLRRFSHCAFIRVIRVIRGFPLFVWLVSFVVNPLRLRQSRLVFFAYFVDIPSACGEAAWFFRSP